MKDEIKEIIESSRKIIKSNRENGFDRIIMLGDDIDKLLDYITNLQTIEQQYNAILSENAELENKIINLQDTLKDREEYCYGLETQITNLKEENEHLRTQLNTLENTVIEVNKECNRLFNHLTKKDLDYKSRNEKAIELLNRHDIDTGDIYYKYNNRFVKSELKERIREILGGDEE